MISASRRVEAPSLHANASSPGMMEGGGLFSDFELTETVPSAQAPRRHALFEEGPAGRLPGAVFLGYLH